MVVTEIVALDKKRSKVYIDREFAFVLYKGELSRYKIKEDEPIDEKAYKEIKGEVLPKRVKLRAMNLLTKRDYTEKQLRDKLVAGDYTEDLIEIAISYVKSFGYIDDDRYIQSYLDIYEGRKPYGKMKEELLRKGIDTSRLQRAIELRQENNEDSGADEEEMARALLEKKHYNAEEADLKTKQKMYGFLARRGFSLDVINHVLKANSNM